jgi:hypothetical protein
VRVHPAFAGNPENDGHLSPWQEAVGREIIPDTHKNGCANEATICLTLRLFVMLFQYVVFSDRNAEQRLAAHKPPAENVPNQISILWKPPSFPRKREPRTACTRTVCPEPSLSRFDD